MGLPLSKSCWENSEDATSFSSHSFPQFYLLSDEIVLEILSYVAEAPFEKDDCDDDDSDDKNNQCTVQSSLTHTLPLVSKQFRKICSTNSLWITSFQNMIYHNPKKWKQALLQLLKDKNTNNDFISPPWAAFHDPIKDKNDFILSNRIQSINQHSNDTTTATITKEDIKKLALDVYHSVQNSEMTTQGSSNKSYSCASFTSTPNHIQTSTSRPSSTSEHYSKPNNYAKKFYLSFIKKYSQISIPVFRMRDKQLVTGMKMHLTFFENRFRYMIHELMIGRNPKYLRGKTMKHPHRPKFLFTNQSLTKGSTAYIAEVCQCTMLRGDWAHVMIHLEKKVTLLGVCERVELNIGLHDAQIKRFY